jgi:hypothetical protein
MRKIDRIEDGRANKELIKGMIRERRSKRANPIIAIKVADEAAGTRPCVAVKRILTDHVVGGDGVTVSNDKAQECTYHCRHFHNKETDREKREHADAEESEDDADAEKNGANNFGIPWLILVSFGVLTNQIKKRKG